MVHVMSSPPFSQFLWLLLGWFLWTGSEFVSYLLFMYLYLVDSRTTMANVETKVKRGILCTVSIYKQHRKLYQNFSVFLQLEHARIVASIMGCSPNHSLHILQEALILSGSIWQVSKYKQISNKLFNLFFFFFQLLFGVVTLMKCWSLCCCFFLSQCLFLLTVLFSFPPLINIWTMGFFFFRYSHLETLSSFSQH